MSNEKDLSFCLVCRYCDRGDDIDSIEDAERAGWVQIDEIEDPDAPWTHVGLCSECVKCEDE